jgi:tetratricopeptide (TPR) repeat protein
MNKRTTSRESIDQREDDDQADAASQDNPWRLRVLLALAGVLLVAAGVVWVRQRRIKLPDVPKIEVQTLEPEVAQAITRARDAVVTAPRSAEAWGTLGMVLHAHSLLDDASPCYAAAGMLEPQNPLWPYLQGLILKDGGSSDAAIDCLKRAASLTQPNSLPRLHLAQLLLDQSRLSEAEAELKVVLDADPKDLHAKLCLGQLRIAQEKYDEAIDDLRAVTHSSYGQAKATALLVTAYERLGNEVAAKRESDRLARLPRDAPWPDPVYEAMSRQQAGLQARITHAKAAISAGQSKEAVAQLRDTVEKYPKSDDAWSLYAKALLDVRDVDDAERAMLRAVDLAPKSRDHHFNLGIVQETAGKTQQAAESFRQAIGLHPGDADAYLMLGECLLKLDDKAAATQAFQNALQHRPNFKQAQIALDKLKSAP